VAVVLQVTLAAAAAPTTGHRAYFWMQAHSSPCVQHPEVASTRPRARLGTTLDENNFLRSYSDDTYLWYDEITDRDPGLFATPEYFDLLKTEATTASGQPKDKFHFTFASDEWFQLSQSGISAGYGAQWVLISASPPREIVVAFTEPNSPAIAPAVNLARGEEVLVADGVDVINAGTQADVDRLNAAFFPSQAGETHTFTVRDLGGATREIMMTSANVVSTPVQNVATIPTATGDVGYMQFNDHIATAESGLIDAVNLLLQAGGVTDLIVDLRYNGGHCERVRIHDCGRRANGRADLRESRVQ